MHLRGAIYPAVTLPAASLHYSESGGAGLQVCRKKQPQRVQPARWFAKESASLSDCPANASPAGNYCTVKVTACDCAIAPSVAVTITLKVPNAVGVLSVSVLEPNFEPSAWDVAVTVAVAGSPGANVGAVYMPFESIVPLPGEPTTDQITAVLALVTVAVNWAV